MRCVSAARSNTSGEILITRSGGVEAAAHGRLGGRRSNFGLQLCADAVELQGRDEADDCARDRGGNDYQIVSVARGRELSRYRPGPTLSSSPARAIRVSVPVWIP